LETLEGLHIGNRFSLQWLHRFIPHNGTALHEAQAAIEKLWSNQEAKEDIMQEEVGSTVIDEDRDTDWEDIEHKADKEPTPSDPESRLQSTLTINWLTLLLPHIHDHIDMSGAWLIRYMAVFIILVALSPFVLFTPQPRQDEDIEQGRFPSFVDPELVQQWLSIPMRPNIDFPPAAHLRLQQRPLPKIDETPEQYLWP
jgi:hypothetical protein